MFKKTKEKINQNEYIVFIKKMWNNKRYRSLLILILYFIFFFLIITGLRSSYQESENINNTEDTNLNNVSVTETMKEQYNKLEDFSYQILINNELLINGNIKDSINEFTYNKKDYTIISNNIYEKDGDNLKKIVSLDSEEIIIPIDKIMVNNIMNYVLKIDSTNEENNDKYEIYYEVPLSYFLINEVGFARVTVSGKEKIETVTIDLSDYKKELYIIKINVGDINV